MKITFIILLYILLHNLCNAQVDYSRSWASYGWEYSGRNDSIIDITTKNIHKKDLSYVLKSDYRNYNAKENIYLHTTNKNKGIQASNEAYIDPKEVSWHKLNPTDLKNTVITQLKLNSDNIEFSIQKELSNAFNETILVLAETEKGASEEDYGLTSHILIVNSATGKIKNYFSESSESNGWVSDAIFIDNINIDTTSHQLSATKKAFGVLVKFRNMSQSNPYNQEIISLFTKEKSSIKKLLDTYTIYESEGVVNVNSCYSDYKKTASRLNASNILTNGYYDILVTNTITQETYNEDKKGECNPTAKVINTEEKVLKFNGIEYVEKQR